MRRLTFAAIAGTLVLAGCGDQTPSPTEPTVPAPEQNFGTTCTVTRFPLLTPGGVVSQIRLVFYPGKLQIEALARATATALLWDTCHPAAAQKVAGTFVNWINQNFVNTKLKGTADQVATLTRTILNGVGVPVETPTSPGDFGIGFFDPNQTVTTTVRTANNTALFELLPAGPGRPAPFNEFTVLTINRKSDDFRLAGFPSEQQFPPFWDYTATNASNNHVIAAGASAKMVFCLIASTFPGGLYPDGVRIGHNRLDGDPESFEIIPETSTEGFTLNCEKLTSNAAIGSFGVGLQGLARAADHYLGPVVQTLFLPQQLHATAVGKLGPLGGLPPTVSDFGVVLPDELRFLPNSNPGGQVPFAENTTLIWRASCEGDCDDWPEVRLVDADGGGIGNVPVTVTLNPVSGSTGSFTEGSTTSQTTSSGDSPGDFGFAKFTDIGITGPTPGTYTLTFSAPGATSITSGQFNVLAGQISPQSCSLEGTIKSLNSNKPVNVTFINNTSQSVSVYWLNFNGQREYPFEGGGIGVPYAVLPPGGTYVQGTFLTHPWILTSPAGELGETCYGIFVPTAQGQTATATAP